MTRTILFQGDSITDEGRTLDPDLELGAGYVRLIAERLERDGVDAVVLNRGVSGDRVEALRRRWDADTLALKPDIVTILVGINDTWRRYDSDDPTTAEAFEADYRHILQQAWDTGARLIMFEPFLLPVLPGQDDWREDLDPKIEVVRRLALEFGATLIPTDRAFADAAARVGAENLLPDGVHPSIAGRGLLADLWLEAADLEGSRA